MTCSGGNGDGRPCVEAGGTTLGDATTGAVATGNCWVFAGGALATEESMTTTFPVRPAWMGGNFVVGAFPGPPCRWTAREAWLWAAEDYPP